jgi:DNA-binding NtrC family response regulator
MRMPKVLLVTKRTADLCATKAMLNSAGFDVMTATDLAVARSVGGCIPFAAAILCKHSFTDEDRENLTAQLRTIHPDFNVIAVCPGCTGCLEEQGIIGSLGDTGAINSVMRILSSDEQL